MQSKGKLGTIVAGVIAIFLAVVCLFYLSFSLISSKHEKKAEQYALIESGDNDDAAYNQAYKHYMDSLGEQKVYLGYTLNDVRKWGVGLGLDLKGGMNVILQVDMPDMLRSMKSGDTDSVFESAIAAAQAAVNAHQTDDFVGTFVTDYRQRRPQADFSVVFQGLINSGAGDDAVRDKLKAEVKDRVDNSATNVLRNRIDQFGVVSPNIQVLQGKDGQILLELPGVKDHERVRDLLQRSANLEFYETYTVDQIAGALNNTVARLAADSAYNAAPLAALLQNPGYGATVGYAPDARTMAAIDELLASNIAKNLLPSDLKLSWSVKPTTRVDANGQEVNFGFALYALRTNGGKPALDGKAVSDADSQYDPLRGNEVSMRMNPDGARAWARITAANINRQVAIVLDDKVYSAPNVNTAIEGGSSSITGDFSLEEAKDLANVLIFERSKEELRAGKNLRTAIADGYSNAFSAIFDSNLTSIITGVILLLFGTGPIKGFATTLIIGLVCSFFTAVFLSRVFFTWFGKLGAFQNITFTTSVSRKMFVNSHVNFLGQRKLSFTVAGILVLVVVASLFMRGLNQGIDFSGGRNYVVKFEQPVNTVELQEALAQEFDGASVGVITIESSNQVRVSTNYKINDENEDTEKEITAKLFNVLKPYLRSGMSDTEFSTTDASQGIVSSQKVGPTVANDMRTDAYIAVIISLIAMFLYILLRFHNVAFSLGALAAVAFTAFTIIGFYSLLYGVLPFAMEVDQTFIAAILTVIGYQINDTVVVFDRVRENVGLYPKQDFFTTINSSINSTLGRTIMTSGSTLLVLLCIFILGGEAIRSFTFAMLLGVIVGTLATIYVAAPVAYIADARRNKATKK